jgi:hypothetical protein
MNSFPSRLIVAGVLTFAYATEAVPNNQNTDWFKEAKYGVFMHFLPADARGLSLVERFDSENLAKQLEQVGPSTW